MVVGGMCSLLPCYLLAFATGYAFKTVLKKRIKIWLSLSISLYFFLTGIDKLDGTVNDISMS